MPSPRSAGLRSRESTARMFGDYRYVRADLIRIAVLTISALIILVAMAFLLPHWMH